MAKSADNHKKKPDSKKEVKEYKIFDYLLSVLFFLFLAILTTNKIFGDDDIFWHLSTGRFILENGYVPSHEVFGYLTSGIKWIPFEWGWEVITYILFKAGNFLLLSVFRTAIILTTFILLFYYLKRIKTGLTFIIIISIPVVIAILPRFSIRPQIIYYLFIAVLVVLLLILRDYNGNKKYFYIFLPLLFLLWANMHMGVLLGIAIFFVFIFSEFISNFNNIKNGNSDSKRELWKLFYVFIISAACLLLNPHFINTYIYTYRYMQLDMLHSINEWKSPFDSTQIGSYNNKIYFFFLFSGLMIIFYSFKKKDIFAALLYLGISVYSLQSARYIAEFFIVIFIFWIISLHFILNKISKYPVLDFVNNNLILKSIVTILLIFLTYSCITNKFYKEYLGNYFRETGFGINDKFFPVQMFNFIRDTKINEIGKKPFNNLKIGGYFTWEFPDSKNFIDSRDLNDSIYALYKNIDLRHPGFENKIESIGIDYVIYDVPFLQYNASEIERNIISYLSRNAEKWKLVYWDDKSFLFLKNEVKFKDIIDKFTYKYISPYNIAFNRALITNGFKNEREQLQNELIRKKLEEPGGFFTNEIDKFLNTIH